MKLFFLYPKELPNHNNPWERWFDKAFGFVVRANDEEEARRIANSNGGDEVNKRKEDAFSNPWLHAEYTVCEELTNEGVKGVIIRDFHSA